MRQLSPWSALIVLVVAWAPAAAETLQLEHGRGGAFLATNIQTGILVREVSRQAILAAARHDCGLPIRDAWLDDVPQGQSAEATFDVVVSPGKPNLIELLVGAPPMQSRLDSYPFAWPDKTPFAYSRYVVELTKYAQSQGAEALRKQFPTTTLKPADEPAARAAAAAAARAVESLLSNMTVVAQFAALRSTHQAVRKHGETPELLGVLVRGYSHLGLLTETYMNPMHHVFKARALVYAQRLANLDSSSTWALAHRAYAYATVGLQKTALDDLDAIRLAGDPANATAGPAAPEWLAVIDDYCRYQLGSLAAAPREAAHFELAQVLRYVGALHSRDQPRTVAVAVETVAAVPECYIVMDLFEKTIESSYDNRTIASNWPPLYDAMLKSQHETLGEKLYVRVAAMEGLPPDAIALLAPAELAKIKPTTEEEYALRGKLIHTLLHTPDTDGDELSWVALGRMIREISFLQAMRLFASADFDATDLPAELQPLVADHPYRSYFQMATNNTPTRVEAAKRLVAALDYDGIESTLYPISISLVPDDFRFKTAAVQTAYERLSDASLANADYITNRQYIQMSGRPDRDDPNRSTSLLNINPYLPCAVLNMLTERPEKVANRVQDWGILADEHPKIAALLARQADALGTPEQQEKTLAAEFVKNPEPETVKRLLKLQWARKDVDAWEQTMRSFIARTNLPDEAIGACNGAASYLVGIRQFERAKPFVDAAVERQDSRAYYWSAVIAEALQDWPAAEEAYRHYSQTQSKRRCEWFFFCRRTGQGDRAAALTQANEQILDHEDPGRVQQRLHSTSDIIFFFDNPIPALFYLLHNEPAKALPRVRDLFIHSDDPQWGLYTALIHDGLGQTTQRDQMLQGARDRGPKYHVGMTKTGRVRTGLIELAKLFMDDLARGGKADFDPAALEKLRTAAHRVDRPEIDHLLGMYYAQRDRQKEASIAWLRSMASTEITSFGRTLAGSKLWDRNVTPTDYREALQQIEAKTPGENNP